MKKKNQGASEEAGSYIWNSVGGILNAGQSVLALMVITRTLGLQAAGIYSIAYATGNLFMYLGNYGVRNYQVSDLKEKYRFSDYLHHRALTVLLMLLCSAVFVLVHYVQGSYDAEKSSIVLAMCVLKCEDCTEEVFEGRLHQRGHLDLAGKMMTVRLLVSVGGMLICAIVTGSLLASVIIAILLAFGSFLFMAYRYRDFIAWDKKEGSPGAVRALMAANLPVCTCSFLSFYLINAPKYAIDSIMDETAQARYNFIAMPVFVIQLLNMFMYQPVLVKMTAAWNGKDQKTFLSSFFRILAGLLVLSAAVLAGAYVLGIPVLSLLYATDLSDLKAELMWILVGSVFLALTGFYLALLTIMRQQMRVPFVYIISSVLSLILTGRMVRRDGIMGGVLSFVFIMIMTAVMMTALFAAALQRQFQKNAPD